MNSEFIFSECQVIAENFQKLKASAPAIVEAARICSEAIRNGGKVLFCGNGGSAADAQHLAAELVGRYEMERPAMSALALTTDTSILTSVSNDYGYDDVFARQVRGLGQSGDVLYAISTSGNSSNVIKAMLAAHERGMKVIAVTGATGGRMKDFCDLLLNVPATRANHVQEMHIAIGHMICGIVEKGLSDRRV